MSANAEGCEMAEHFLGHGCDLHAKLFSAIVGFAYFFIGHLRLRTPVLRLLVGVALLLFRSHAVAALAQVFLVGLDFVLRWGFVLRDLGRDVPFPSLFLVPFPSLWHACPTRAFVRKHA